MVAINYQDEERSSRVELIVSKATLLHETVEGEFGEDTFYYLNGEAYHISDLPDYILGYASFILETYIKMKKKEKSKNQENDNQR